MNRGGRGVLRPRSHLGSFGRRPTRFFRETPYLGSKRLYPARLGRWPRRRPGRAPSSSPQPRKRPGGPATTHQEAVARQKQPGWDEPEETLQARRDGDATMQPAVRLLLGSLPQPVCHQPEATGYVRSDRRIAVWRRVGSAGQFGETTNRQLGIRKPFGVRGDLPAVPSKCQQQFPVQVGARELIWASFRYRIPNQSRTAAGGILRIGEHVLYGENQSHRDRRSPCVPVL
jgi:hypothetical protein